MSLYEIGRLCVKIAGRDAGRKCVVVDQLDETFVIVDGDVRRKRVNTKHLEPLTLKIQIKEGAAHEEVKKAFEKLSLSVWETNPRSAGKRARRKRKAKSKESKSASQPLTPEEKKEEKKVKKTESKKAEKEKTE